MKIIYQLLRVACFIALPLFFQQKELTPQPVKNMLLAFLAGVITAEILVYFIKAFKVRTFLIFLPLILVLLFIFPYRFYLNLFAWQDRILIYDGVVFSLLYILDRKWIYPRMFS
ncbi:MAG: hypothetical protein JWN78_1431 [Bacteroidota bacterium]|nr:hypothetical protein [Bacteroidota bacterium]